MLTDVAVTGSFVDKLIKSRKKKHFVRQSPSDDKRLLATFFGVKQKRERNRLGANESVRTDCYQLGNQFSSFYGNIWLFARMSPSQRQR
jgi:hypothetical protein